MRLSPHPRRPSPRASLSLNRPLKNSRERRVNARGLQDFPWNYRSCRPGALTGRLLPCAVAFGLMLLGALTARAQFLSPDDFFNSGAQFYISNNIPLAKERTAMGLQLYPNDEKLKKLDELLKQQQQSQSSQSQQNQQNQSQQNKSQQNQKNQQQQQQQQANQSQSEKDKAEQAKKDAEQKQKEEQEKQAQAAQQKNGDDKSGGDTNQMTDAKGAHAMTPKEAERLLDAQKDSEQYLSLKPKDKPPKPNHVLKDW